MGSERNHAGMTVWLAILIMWMTVIRPLSGVYVWQRMHLEIYANPAATGSMRGWAVNTSIMCLLVLGLGALSIYGGYRLWRDRSPAAIRCAIAILWISALIAVAVLLIYGAFWSRGGQPWAEVLRSIFINGLTAGIWTAYLLRSRRVRSRYYLADHLRSSG
jgi:hypothetical protein